MKYLVAALGLLLSLNSAQAAPTFFFGGVGAKASVMNSCYGYTKNYGYPADGSVSSVVSNINSHPKQSFTLVGHSSGAKYLTQIAARVKNPSRITLVSLDGFAPRGAPKSVHTVCWRATNGHGVHSKNYQYMTHANNCKEIKTITAPSCKTAWCLHFALVNQVPPSNLGSHDFIARGYAKCRPVKSWLVGRKMAEADEENGAPLTEQAAATVEAPAPPKKPAQIKAKPKTESEDLGYIKSVLKEKEQRAPAIAPPPASVSSREKKVKKEPESKWSNDQLSRPYIPDDTFMDNGSAK